MECAGFPRTFPAKLDQFIAIMKPLGLVEICRTGVAAMNRGPQGM